MDKKVATYRYKKAFTLAEVLITLLIIGIVSSIVIPALLQDTQEAELHTALKKAYSSIYQATLLIKNDNGGSLKNVFTGADDWGQSMTAVTIYASYMSGTKVCSDDTGLGCWHSSDKWYGFDGSPMGWDFSGDGLILNDGMFAGISIKDGLNCNDQVYAGTFKGHGICGVIDVDVNGFKPPNKVGKDIYSFIIQENGVYPHGVQEDPSFNSAYCESNGGWACTAKYMYQ